MINQLESNMYEQYLDILRTELFEVYAYLWVIVCFELKNL